jgi:purine nucleosidase
MQTLLIDTDPGVDDALALLMAHAHAGTRVAAITTTAGNVGLAHTTRNARKLLALIGAATPVHAGCETPLVRPAADAAFVHGSDGFGDVGYEPVPEPRAPTEHAALAMSSLARRHPGELTFVMLGPLTNLALALRLDPTLPSRVPRLVIMGGAVTGRGNTSVPAEFNIGFDPEAAQIVFAAWPRFELVDWEATVAHGIDFARFEAWLDGPGARAAFYKAISRKTRDFARRGREKMLTADALAMAAVLEPGCVVEWAERPVAVELDGHLTRGATVVDWQRRSGAADNAKIAMRFDQARFEALVATGIAAGA